MSPYSVLPGGSAVRVRAAGVRAGAPGTRVEGPSGALGLVAEEMALAERELRNLVHSDVAAVPAVAGVPGRRRRQAAPARADRPRGARGGPVPGADPR